MLKKTIKYTDFNGVEREEDFYFNFSQAELAEMELSSEGGMEAYINRIVSTKDNRALVKIFKELILKAYGVKSLDGKRFEKSEELSTAFSQTNAYSQLFMELATNADAATKFINGVIPAEAKQASAMPGAAPAGLNVVTPR